MSKKITGFGDFLIHFSPTGDDRFFQADYFRISFTGAEANVCAALAFWGEPVSFVTRLPQHTLAQRGIHFLKSFGIQTEHIAQGGERMGLYFLEKGISIRPSQVIYDRIHTGFTESRPEDYNWDAILENTEYLYLTGITPALSPNLFQCCLKLCELAHSRGIKIIYDVNYRPTLSSPEEAGQVLKTLAPYLYCLISNEEHLKLLLNLHSMHGEDTPALRLQDLIGQARSMLVIPKIAVTVRRTPSASDAVFYAGFDDGICFALSREYRIHVADRVGSGDAFSAGLLWGMRKEKTAAEAVEFAAASCAIKHTILNDINFATVDEINKAAAFSSMDVKR